MPITGQGFEIHVVRRREQKRKVGVASRTRTVGTYAVFINGVEKPGLAGTMAEQKGPSDSSPTGNEFDRRIKPGRYPLSTQDGTKYKTIGYVKTTKAAKDFSIKPRPGIELNNTGSRSEILIHPAQNFLSSEGCIHPSGPLPNGDSQIDHNNESRPRVIALIEAMKAFCGADFPTVDGRRIPNCFCVIDDDIQA
jgi:hypothetical protein